MPASKAAPPTPNQPPNQPAWPAWADPPQRATLAAPALPQRVNTSPNTNTNTMTNKDNNSKVKEDRRPLPVPSNGTTGSEGGVADRAAVMREVEEARGNPQSLRGKVQRCRAKLGRCREPGDVSRGIAAGEKVWEKPRLREAQRAFEELGGKLVYMGMGQGGVKQRRDDIVQLVVGVERHPEENPVAAEEKGGGGSKADGGDEPTLLPVTEWMPPLPVPSHGTTGSEGVGLRW